MKTRRPINAKNTSRILNAILPPEFKITNDRSSNGYKFINLLYGNEVDHAQDRIEEAYNNSFISTLDLSEDYSLYEVRLSGIPNSTHLDSSEGQIKIASDTEFYYGDPTRIRHRGSIPLSTGTIPSGIIGLNYFRTNERGSGYLLGTLNREQKTSYLNSVYPAYRINLGTSFDSVSDIKDYSGLYTGIATQRYGDGSTDEILTPIDSGTLKKKYPLTRDITDESGIVHTIDYYEPYHGWIKDETGTAKAVIDYEGTYYYDSKGSKIYYRTALNNPYGYNNYNVAYLDLRNIPISGTLKVYDIDILDTSGNATEIPQDGKTLYYLQSPTTNVIGSGSFEPTYLGYDRAIPEDMGFGSDMVGRLANPLKTTSWDYLHEGGGINSESLQYVDGSGNITNRIKISNPHSRYLVEYKYVLHDYSRYISILDSAGYVNLHGLDPIYTLENISGNLVEREFEFTKDPSFIDKDSNGAIVRENNAKRITFDGLDVRPGKSLFRIDVDVPLVVSAGPLLRMESINANKQHLGYIGKYVPEVSTIRNNYLCCNFDQPIVSGSVTESDTTGNSNFLTFVNTGSSSIHRINYGSYYGKKIMRGSGDSYFEKQSVSFLSEYAHIACGCRFAKRNTITLFDISDQTHSSYMIAKVQTDGLLSIRMNGYKFISNRKITFDKLNKEFIIRFRPDDVSSSVPYIEAFYSSADQLGFRELKLNRYEDVTDTLTSTYLRCFSNCAIDIDYFKVYNEVF